MRKRLIGAVAVVIVIAVTYLVGYWPQRSLRLAVETQAGELEASGLYSLKYY